MKLLTCLFDISNVDEAAFSLCHKFTASLRQDRAKYNFTGIFAVSTFNKFPPYFPPPAAFVIPLRLSRVIFSPQDRYTINLSREL